MFLHHILLNTKAKKKLKGTKMKFCKQNRDKRPNVIELSLVIP